MISPKEELKLNNQIKYNILFVEDEKEIRDNYTKYLKRHFTNVYEAVDGEDGYRVYKDKNPEIMIVDINLPKLNGIDLVKKIRENDQIVKLIMLTAYSDVHFLLQASELKLVKYLVKPITRNELKDALDLAVNEFSKFEVIPKDLLSLKDGFTWNYQSGTVFNEKGDVYLTQKEKQIVALLFSNPNYVFTYDDIIVEVWGDFQEDKLDPLKTLVKNIRKKLPSETIKNVFGVGYKF